jgi:hypothetical protein
VFTDLAGAGDDQGLASEHPADAPSDRRPGADTAVWQSGPAPMHWNVDSRILVDEPEAGLPVLDSYFAENSDRKGGDGR